MVIHFFLCYILFFFSGDILQGILLAIGIVDKRYGGHGYNFLIAACVTKLMENLIAASTALLSVFSTMTMSIKNP